MREMSLSISLNRMSQPLPLKKKNTTLIFRPPIKLNEDDEDDDIDEDDDCLTRMTRMTT